MEKDVFSNCGRRAATVSYTHLDVYKRQVLYALFGVLTVFGTGNATQVNTIVSSIHSALHNLHIIDGTVDERANLIFGIFIAAFVAMVLLGGIQRIGQVSEKLVPFMAALYAVSYTHLKIKRP